MEDLCHNHVLGKVIGVAYTIEFQKRGLPHAHIVFMVHGPCGELNSKCACMKDHKCTTFFPKDYTNETTIDSKGYAVYKRRNDGRTIMCKDVEVDNRFIVPYNRGLIVKYQAHINVEWCNQGRMIKYMFKYVTKGPDRATMAIEKSENNEADYDDNNKDDGKSKKNENMRIEARASPVTISGEKMSHADWVINVGDGKVQTVSSTDDGDSCWIQIPPEIFLDPKDDGKKVVLDRWPGKSKVYFSSDSICKGSINYESQETMYPTEILNSMKFAGIPNHELKLKVGAPIVLLRNIAPSKGLFFNSL
ncbi:hypothetical protein POM88_046893 [Heracleum sosnowskyi]|uniref:ATP-dependent DNA helicase n=1 Tax=Heracleum sosnowskyi TaxID=360622 RepID=A0AAD8M7B1_9APIA|nr:hypothetical protein POM88_046893 [Heracleum sosnowskyi]